MSKLVRKAVIPAAGLGTRFLPATKVVPKELLPIVDRPTLQYILEELADAGVEEFIIVLSRGKEALLKHFQPHSQLENDLREKEKLELLSLCQRPTNLGRIRSVYQDKALGLGHAVLCAREAVGNEPFLVCLGDDLIDAHPNASQQMVSCFGKFQKPLVAVQKVPRSEVHKYGIIDPCFSMEDSNYYMDPEKRLIPLKDLVEKPKPERAPSHLAIVGRYLLTPDVFPILEKTGKGAGGEIQLTDALRTLNKEKGILAYRFEGERFDAGDKLGYLYANLYFGLKHPQLGAPLRKLVQSLISKK